MKPIISSLIEQLQIKNTDEDLALSHLIGAKFYKGPVATVDNLPLSSENDGDLYLIKNTNLFMRWDGIHDEYVPVGGTTSTPDDEEPTGGSPLASNTQQINLINVPANYSCDIAITATTNYDRPPIEVLKFVPGTDNVTTVECDFLASDAEDFIHDDQVTFDGQLYLINSYSLPIVDEGVFGTSHLYSIAIDLSAYKSIDRLVVN